CRIAALFGDGQLGAYLQEAQAALATLPPDDPDIVRYQGEWLVLRSGQAYLQHDLVGAAAYAAQAQAVGSHLNTFHTGTLHFIQMHLHGYAGAQAAMVAEAEAA